GGAEDAAVGAGGRRRRQFAEGPGQAALLVVEDVVVGAGARPEDVRVAHEQPEVRAVRAALVDQALVVPLCELLQQQRLQPRLPAELLLREGVGRLRLDAGDRLAHASSPFRTVSPATTRSWKLR